MWWKKNKWKVIVPVLVVAVLAAAFWYGGGAPGLHGWSVHPEQSDTLEAAPSPSSDPSGPDTASRTPETPDPEPGESGEKLRPEETASPEPEPSESPAEEAPSPEPEPSGPESRPGGLAGGMTAGEKVETAAELAGEAPAGTQEGDREYSESQGMVLDPETGKDRYLTNPVPEGKPLPVEPEDVEVSDTAYTCTISISCASVLDHMDWLDPEKTEVVPEDGWVLPAQEVTFYEGESVFNVLQRTCKQQGIHLEFVNTPMYHSAYIEGIHNLYEFDCGELSGWMYRVNDWFPNYGCSRYQLQDGDVICWEYTCDLGVDIGGYNAIGG